MAEPTIRVILMPRDTNAWGTIFGGVILSHVDLAGAAEARKHGTRRFVTAAIREVEFKEPVYVGDLVSFYTETLRIGRTSVTVRVRVEAERVREPGRRVEVTAAEIVFVCVDDVGRPTPVRGA
jgi:acyl-CoA thioesterase YciA